MTTTYTIVDRMPQKCWDEKVDFIGTLFYRPRKNMNDKDKLEGFSLKPPPSDVDKITDRRSVELI